MKTYSCLGFPIYNGNNKRLRKKETHDALEPEVNLIKVEHVQSFNSADINNISYEVSIDDPEEIDKNPPPINSRDEKPAAGEVGKVKRSSSAKRNLMSYVSLSRGKLIKSMRNIPKSKSENAADQIPGVQVIEEAATLTSNEVNEEKNSLIKPNEKTTADNNGEAREETKEEKLVKARNKVNTLDRKCYTRKVKSQKSESKTWSDYAQWLKVYLNRDELLPVNKFGAAGANHFLSCLQDGKILCQLLTNVQHCRLTEAEMVDDDDRINICLIQKHCLEDLGMDRKDLLVWEDFLFKDVNMVCNTLLYIGKAIMFYHRNIPGMSEQLKERARRVELPDPSEKVHEHIDHEPDQPVEKVDQANGDDVEKNRKSLKSDSNTELENMNIVNAAVINADNEEEDNLSDDGEDEYENENVEYTSGGVREQLGDLVDKATQFIKNGAQRAKERVTGPETLKAGALIAFIGSLYVGLR